MHVLVTAGNTRVALDRVRCLTNIFTGRTGSSIALATHARGHFVTLLTSNPEVLADMHPTPGDLRWRVIQYTLFQELSDLLAEMLARDPPDALIHSAAVSDFMFAGAFAPDLRTHFEAERGRWVNPDGIPKLVDRNAAKIKSDAPELWLRLVRAPKLIDLVRSAWGFRGLLVKFKLEVGISDDQLLAIAEQSRRHSQADLMVANTLDDAARHAFLGLVDGGYRCVQRSELAEQLIDRLEQLAASRS